MAMSDTISWVATVATVLAAFMTASNLGSRVTGLGFAVFTLGALCWIRVGILDHEPALVWTNLVLTALDLFGVWRWLGRQARMEEGARTASEASEHTPGEALFPVSLLSRAPVRFGTTELGHCLEAMASCRSGKLDYLVVSEGGVAGVGERLRRLPWADAHVEDDEVVVHLKPELFDRLEELKGHEWPGR
ncbi:MAG TPA: PRC-barrel domain containing protein [Sphingomicrobium sp.]|nr:PRC-barrel domain containing protein [Sphingomicrobium sp.]